MPADGQGDGAKAAADGAEAAANGSGADGEAVLRAVLASIDAEEVNCDEDSDLLDRLGQLDLLLTWLWRVHGIDYYAGPFVFGAWLCVDNHKRLHVVCVLQQPPGQLCQLHHTPAPPNAAAHSLHTLLVVCLLPLALLLQARSCCWRLTMLTAATSSALCAAPGLRRGRSRMRARVS